MVRSRDELAADVLKRLDQTGDIARVKDGTSLLASSSVGRLFLRAAGVHPAKARELIQRTDDIILTAARYVEVFAPRGWAPCELTPLGAASRALTELNRTGSMEAAESILIAGWAEGKHLDFAWSRLIGLGIKDPAMGEIHRARARLIKTALKHHRQSEYAASVPIVLAQIDGLVADLTHGQHGFFHKVDRAMLSDIHTLAGLPEGLSELQPIFGAPHNSTTANGARSRHGILHGRELAYDTERNSTQAFVLMLALVELATATIDSPPRDPEDRNRRA